MKIHKGIFIGQIMFQFLAENKCDHICRTLDLVTFTEEILNGNLHFLCSDTCHKTLIDITDTMSKQQCLRITQKAYSRCQQTFTFPVIYFTNALWESSIFSYFLKFFFSSKFIGSSKAGLLTLL